MEPIVAEKSFIDTLALFMKEGGVFMWIIFTIWSLGVAIALERLKSYMSFDIDGNSLMSVVKKHILLNDVSKAIGACSNTKSLLANVLKSGLQRCNQSKENIKDAMEASIMESLPKLEKRLSQLGLIANVSTLIGLLGTIYGLIQSFGAVATADPSQKAQLLALGISKAMNTTALGLISAISIMMLHSFLNAKAEKMTGEIEEYSLKLVDLLGTKKNDNAA